MTREDAIEAIKEAYGNSEYTDEIINALEQEQDKPMVEIDLYSVIKQKYIEREVLDKIRAEIEQIIREEIVVDCSGGEYERIVSTIDPDDILEILDKYKAESEVKT